MRTLVILALVMLVFACAPQKSSYQQWIENQPQTWSGMTSDQSREHVNYKRYQKCQIRYTLKCFLEGH